MSTVSAWSLPARARSPPPPPSRPECTHNNGKRQIDATRGRTVYATRERGFGGGEVNKLALWPHSRLRKSSFTAQRTMWESQLTTTKLILISVKSASHLDINALLGRYFSRGNIRRLTTKYAGTKTFFSFLKIFPYPIHKSPSCSTRSTRRVFVTHRRENWGFYTYAA